MKTRTRLGSFFHNRAVAAAGDWPVAWTQRTGVSRETGLLKEWPKEGPKLLWSITNAGSGYSTPSVVGDRIYLLGNDGPDNEFVRALSVKDGATVWSTRIGKVGNPAQQPNFPGARSTPTLDGEYLCALGSDGDLACLETGTGKVRWQKNLRTDFGGKPGQWAYAESPLIAKTRSSATRRKRSDAAGAEQEDRRGARKCALPEADEAGYASAIVVEAASVRQFVQLPAKRPGGCGRRLASSCGGHLKVVSRYGANIPTPVAGDGHIYAASAGTGGGLIRLTAMDHGIHPEEVYFESKLPTAIGGAVKIGKCSTYGPASRCSVSILPRARSRGKRVPGTASICCADGHLYLHGETARWRSSNPPPSCIRKRDVPPAGPAQARQ